MNFFKVIKKFFKKKHINTYYNFEKDEYYLDIDQSDYELHSIFLYNSEKEAYIDISNNNV